MLITVEKLRAIAPHGNEKILQALPSALNYWLPIYGLTDKRIVQMYLAQAAEETDGFKTFQEYASGRAYEWRKDLGNVHAGDGVKYKGRGMFDTTGLANYTKEAKELGIDIVNHPELLLIATNAVHAACAYWADHHLTPFALANDINTVTHRINGGLNGLADRITYWHRAQLVMTENLDIPPHVTVLGAIPSKPIIDAPQITPQAQVPPVAPLPQILPNPIPAPQISKPTGLWAWLLAFFKPHPVGNGIIGDFSTMSLLPNSSTFNIASLIGIATSFGAALPQIYSTFGTNGLIGAGAFAVCFLIQAFLPVGTASAIENVAISAIPIAEGIDPALIPALEKVLAGMKAEQAIPAKAA